MCTCQMFGYRYSKINPATGKHYFKLIGKIMSDNDLKKPLFHHDPECGIVTDVVTVPCGSCIECRLAYSREWANRCVLEASCWQNNYFVTLTYKDLCLPRNSELKGTLDFKDCVDFLKRVRTYYERKLNWSNIRVYYCGEYGDLSSRPHFHIIFFNLPLFDLEYWFSKDGMAYYTSQTLSDLWENNGIVCVTDCNWNTCAYTARYVMKKHMGKDSSFYKENDLTPEAVRMSRKPGIGWYYFDEHKDEIIKTDSVVINKGKNIATVRPPTYFSDKIDELDPSAYERIMNKRRVSASAINDLIRSKTNLDFLEYERVRAERRAERAKIFFNREKFLDNH